MDVGSQSDVQSQTCSAWLMVKKYYQQDSPRIRQDKSLGEKKQTSSFTLGSEQNEKNEKKENEDATKRKLGTAGIIISKQIKCC